MQFLIEYENITSYWKTLYLKVENIFKTALRATYRGLLTEIRSKIENIEEKLVHKGEECTTNN